MNYDPRRTYWTCKWGTFEIPGEVEIRANRLHQRFGRLRSEYFDDWCTFQWHKTLRAI